MSNGPEDELPFDLWGTQGTKEFGDMQSAHLARIRSEGENPPLVASPTQQPDQSQQQGGPTTYTTVKVRWPAVSGSNEGVSQTFRVAAADHRLVHGSTVAHSSEGAAGYANYPPYTDDQSMDDQSSKALNRVVEAWYGLVDRTSEIGSTATSKIAAIRENRRSAGTIEDNNNLGDDMSLEGQTGGVTPGQEILITGLAGPSPIRSWQVRDKLNARYVGTEAIDPRSLGAELAVRSDKVAADFLADTPIIGSTDTAKQIQTLTREQAGTLFIRDAAAAHQRTLVEKAGGEKTGDRTVSHINGRILAAFDSAPDRALDEIVVREPSSLICAQIAFKAMGDIEVFPFALHGDNLYVSGKQLADAVDGDPMHPEIPPIADRALRGMRSETWGIDRDNHMPGEAFTVTGLVEDINATTFPRPHYLIAYKAANVPAAGEEERYVDVRVEAIRLTPQAESSMRSFMLSPDAIEGSTPNQENGQSRYDTAGKINVHLHDSLAYLSDPGAIGKIGERQKPWLQTGNAALTSVKVERQDQ